MKIAIWSEPSGDWFAKAYALHGHEVVRVPAYQAAALLESGEADAGLLPSLAVLRNPAIWAVSAKVALVSEEYPFMRIGIRDGLDQIRRVAFDPRYQQEILMLRILLREHYDAEPAFVPIEPDQAASWASRMDTALLAGDGTEPKGVVSLDLGQEWLDLTIYPTVWGLMAMPKAKMNEENARALAAILEDTHPLVIPQNEAQEVFWETSFSPKLDDFALAGFFATVELFFANTVLDEIPEVPFYVYEEAESETDDEEDDEHEHS